MPLEKLPVPDISLSTQDVGSVFQGKMNAAIEAVRAAIVAFNNQIDAAQTASQQVEPAPFEIAVAGGNNSYKMTPLRVMQAMDSKLAGFGIGGSSDMLAVPKFVPVGAIDANTITAPGWFKGVINAGISANMPPTPSGGTQYWFIENLYYAAGNLTIQRAHNYPFSSSPGYVFQRAFAGESWQSWAPFIVPPVGTVGVVSGVSTGSIIERGGNANGDYVKFADGTMICTYYRAGDIPMSAGYGVSGLYMGTFSWTFPASFLVAPQVTGSGSDPSRVGWVSAYNLGASSCSPVYFTGSAAVNPCGIHMVAIGRWR